MEELELYSNFQDGWTELGKEKKVTSGPGT
jgi:hypothetical protein